jgi:uncharacterized membrane protein
MADVRATAEVNRPLSTVYNQWTHFEEFPRFMEGVEMVRQLDDVTLEWRASIGGIDREWRAKIVEQKPDEAIAWISTDGTRNHGRVTFEPVGASKTRVELVMDLEPEGVAESVGDAIGIIKRRVEGDLERFCEFVEGRVSETGAWRGEIPNGGSRPELWSNHPPASGKL